MTEALDPEIRSMRAIARELDKHDPVTRERMLAFFWSRENGAGMDEVRSFRSGQSEGDT